MSKLNTNEERLPKRPLPVGTTEFKELIDALVVHPDVPTKDVDSITFSVAAIIMHSDEGCDALPIEFFVRQLRAGAAKQIAHSAFVETKNKVDAAKKALEEVSNEPTSS